MTQALVWIPAAVAPHADRLAAAIGAHVEAVVREAVDRAIAALSRAPDAISTPSAIRTEDERSSAQCEDPLAGVVAERTYQLDEEGDEIERAVDSMLGPPNHRPAPEPATDRLQANGKRWPSCKKCGFVGGTSRGCGRSHKTIASASPGFAALLKHIEPDLTAPMTAIEPEKPRGVVAPHELAAARVRSKERLERMRKLDAKRKALSPAPELDDNPTAEERWSPATRRAEEERAETHKHEGELPAPRSSWIVTPRTTGDIGHGGDLGDVEELNFG